MKQKIALEHVSDIHNHSTHEDNEIEGILNSDENDEEYFDKVLKKK